MFSIIGLCAFFKRRAGGGDTKLGHATLMFTQTINVFYFKEITKTKSQLISKMSAFALPAKEIYTDDR